MSGLIRIGIRPTAIALSLLLPVTVFAWYPAYSRLPDYGPYSYPYFAGPGLLQGYHYGYVAPRWAMRGRINRYGDFRLDIKARDVNWRDLYTAWLLYQQYGYQ